ncbi:MAG: hypothetical protein WBE47_14755, partial [Candidatus Acidiferrales bacterium]
PPAIEFAVKASGGWRRLHTCSEDGLVWCRKTFLDRLAVIGETTEVEHLLSDGEAKRILADLQAGPSQPNRNRLAPTPESPTFRPIQQEVRAALNHAVAEKPIEAPSEEELEKRRQRMLRQIEEWKTNHSAESERAEVSA